VTFCGIIQYGVLWAAMVGYTITSSSSMRYGAYTTLDHKYFQKDKIETK
jgi:hypothetical protein